MGYEEVVGFGVERVGVGCWGWLVGGCGWSAWQPSWNWS